VPWWAVVGLATCFFLAFVVAAGVAASRWLRPALALRPQPVTSRPLDLLDPEAVRPQFVLEWLAGAGQLEVARRALEAGELQTAYALVLFADESDVAAQISLVLDVARRVEGDTSSYEAASLFVMAGQAAVTAPLLNDATRAQFLLEAGDGLLARRRTYLAFLAWQQVSIVARYSPEIPPQMRDRLLEALVTRYEGAGDLARAVAVRELVAQPATSGGERSALPARWGVPVPAPWPDDVMPYVEQRRRVARAVGEEIEAGSPPSWTALEEALLAEEVAIGNWLARPTDDPLGRQERYRRWVQQRRLLALGVLGPGTLPALEARRAEWDQVLTNLWDQQEAGLDALLAPLPPLQQHVARQVWLERRLFAHVLGHDPLGDSARLRQALEVINGALGDAGQRLSLVAQPNEQIGTYYWRLPVGYLQGRLPADQVFR